MTQAANRQRFTRAVDWHNFLRSLPNEEGVIEFNFYELRKQCYHEIERLRGRPLIIYATQFPGPPGVATSIDLHDVDGFADLADSIANKEAVDVLIHSPGGSPESTERLVSLLRTTFTNIAFLVPHSAYSAATMMALSGNEIILHPSASLGPIDPQINGIPARALRRGFANVRKVLAEEGPEALPAYMPLIEKQSIEILEICEDYENLSKELVGNWIRDYMFGGDDSKMEVIDRAVEFFSAYDVHKTHSRSLTFDRVKDLGLNIRKADGELAVLMREAYVQLIGFMNITPFVKLYENSIDLSWGRQSVAAPQPKAQPAPPK